MSTPLALLDTDVETDLRHTVRDLLIDRCPAEAVRATYDGDRSIVTRLWKALGIDLGLAGLLIPEEQGGAGAGVREAAVVLEELGFAVAPVPFLTSAVIATTVLLECAREADSEVISDLMSSLASGEHTAALLVPLSTARNGRLAFFTVDAAGSLTGAATSVAGALEADTLLVPVAVDGGVALYAVDATAAGLTPVSSLDMSRGLADVRLDGVPGRLLADDAEAAMRTGLDTGAALLASEQVGIARWCLEATVSYLKTRRQFGRVVGGFQALKHRLADLYAAVESGTAAAHYAAAALAAGDPDWLVAASVAQAYCGDLAVCAAEEALQLHGGIGMTWEHPTHLYLKRAKADQIALGTPSAHRAALAGFVDLPVAEA
jgi:alkylation response protein AidB-like acyl-CoA dehydrogenase